MPGLRLHLRQAIFRDGENNGDGLQLRDYRENRSAARLDDVSGINQTQSYAPGDWRRYMAEGNLYFVELYRALIIFYRAFVLQYDLFLVIEGLLWNAVPGPGVAVSLQVHVGLRQDVDVAVERTLGLQKLRLEGRGSISTKGWPLRTS